MEAPPEVVVAVMTEIDHWPEWTPTVSHVEWLGLGRIIGWMMRVLDKRYIAGEAAGLTRRSEERAHWADRPAAAS